MWTSQENKGEILLTFRSTTKYQQDQEHQSLKKLYFGERKVDFVLESSDVENDALSLKMSGFDMISRMLLIKVTPKNTYYD